MSYLNFMTRAKDTYKKSVYDFITDIYMSCAQNVLSKLLSKHLVIILSSFETNKRIALINVL